MSIHNQIRSVYSRAIISLKIKAFLSFCSGPKIWTIPYRAIIRSSKSSNIPPHLKNDGSHTSSDIEKITYLLYNTFPRYPSTPLILCSTSATNCLSLANILHRSLPSPPLLTTKSEVDSILKKLKLRITLCPDGIINRSIVILNHFHPSFYPH